MCFLTSGQLRCSKTLFPSTCLSLFCLSSSFPRESNKTSQCFLGYAPPQYHRSNEGYSFSTYERRGGGGFEQIRIMIRIPCHALHTKWKVGTTPTHVHKVKSLILHVFCNIFLCKTVLSYFVVFGNNFHCLLKKHL